MIVLLRFHLGEEKNGLIVGIGSISVATVTSGQMTIRRTAVLKIEPLDAISFHSLTLVLSLYGYVKEESI